MTDKDKEVTFEIEEHFGTIGTSKSTGWKKELNMVAWNGTPGKYDIRDWDDEHKTMSRGVTFHKDEMLKLKEIIEELNIIEG